MIPKVALLVTAAAVALVAVGCGGQKDRSSEIAAKIHADSCKATRYAIVSRIDKSKTTIYDCTVDNTSTDANGAQTFGSKRICVTEENGIAHDATAEVRILFANVLGDARPSCLA